MTPLSGDEPGFMDAYGKAANSIKQAVIDFEAATGRTVDGLDLQKLDVTRIGDQAPRLVRQVQLDVLPIPSELAWA